MLMLHAQVLLEHADGTPPPRVLISIMMLRFIRMHFMVMLRMLRLLLTAVRMNS